MSPLVVEVDGRVLRLEGNSVIRIGRAIDAEVVLTAGSVSRQHAELRPVDGLWVLVDAGSQFGTYVNGVRVVEHTIRDRTLVRCGPVATGSELTITPAEQTAARATGVGHAPAVPRPPAAATDAFRVVRRADDAAGAGFPTDRPVAVRAAPARRPRRPDRRAPRSPGRQSRCLRR